MSSNALFQNPVTCLLVPSRVQGCPLLFKEYSEFQSYSPKNPCALFQSDSISFVSILIAVIFLLLLDPERS